MKRLWAIIPAAVLGIGAATAGVFANADSADKKSVSIDYLPTPSNDSGRIDEKTSTSTISAQAGAQSYLMNNSSRFCDNYIDGVCWQDGSGCGYHHGNGNHHGNSNHHGNGNHH